MTDFFEMYEKNRPAPPTPAPNPADVLFEIPAEEEKKVEPPAPTPAPASPSGLDLDVLAAKVAALLTASSTAGVNNEGKETGE